MIQKKLEEMKRKHMREPPDSTFWKAKILEGNNSLNFAKEFAEAQEKHRMRFGGAPQDILKGKKNRRVPLNDDVELQRKLAEDDEAEPMPPNAKDAAEQKKLLGWKEAPLKPTKYIASITPQSCRGRERADIAIAVRPGFSGVGFCKFGDVIVKGRVRSDYQLHCKAPEHKPGIVRLSVSIGDDRDFFGGATFEFTRDPLINWNYILVPVGVAILVVVFLFVFALCAGGKKTKRRRRKRAANPSISQKESKSLDMAVTRRQPAAFV